MSNEERSGAQGRPVTAAGTGQGQAQGAAGGYHDDVLVPEAVVEDRRYRWLPSLIWLLPLLAALVGAILTYRQMTQHGPTITVSFKTAEGLEAGKTKLRYKDVEVGQVKSIELADDRSHVEVDIELNRKAGSFRAKDSRYWVVRPRADIFHMPVLIEVFSDRMKRGRGLQAQGPLGAGMTQKELEEEGNRWLQNMVQRGLRAQLRTGNLLTGQLYVSLDFFPQAKPAEMRSVQGDLMELPTVGNSLDEFQQQIAEILAKINKVPFDQIGRDLQQTLAGMRRTVNAAEKTIKGLNDNLAPQLMGTIQSLKKTLDSADRTLVSANRTLASDSPTQEELQQTLRSVSKAADSLRRLTDYLERHPESLLRGKTGN